MLRRGMVLLLIAGTVSARADAPAPNLPAVPEVPALSTRPPGVDDARRGRALNVEGLKLHRAGKYGEAVAKYREALKVDPSNTIARYNLASVLVTKGEPKRGLAVLAQFRVAGCDKCRQRLRDAQADKEWEPLWKDPEFQAVVAFAAEGSPPADPGPGPAAGGAPAQGVGMQLELPQDRADDEGGPSDPPHAPPGKDRVRGHLWWDAAPGFYRPPATDLVLRGAAGVAARAAVAGGDGTHASAELVVPGGGHWTVEAVVGGQVVGADTFAAGEKRCLGGRRELELGRPGAGLAVAVPEEVGAEVPDADQGAMIFLKRWTADTGNSQATVEWRRGGKVVDEATALIVRRDPPAAETLEKAGRLEDLAAICPFSLGYGEIGLPAEVLERPGEWEARFHERGNPSLAITLRYKKGKLRDATVTVAPIATPEALLKEWAGPTPRAQGAPKPAAAAEVRALLRSPEVAKARLALNAARRARKPTAAAAAELELERLVGLNGAFLTDDEMPLPLATPVPAAAKLARPAGRIVKGAACSAAGCPRFPAVAPDGSAVVLWAEEELAMFPGQCAPPTARFLRFYEVKTKPSEADSPIPSRSLAGWKPLQCSPGKLPGGLKLVEGEDDDRGRFQVKDARGKVLAEIAAGGEHAGYQACVAPAQRVLLVLAREGLGGDCDVVSWVSPYAIRY